MLSHIKLGKIIWTFSDIEAKKKFYHKSLIFKKDIVSSKISSGEKTVNTLLITGIMITKLSHYI